MKSVRCRRGGKFNLVLAILAGIVFGLASLARWLITDGGDTWLRETTKKMLGQERQLMSPEMAVKFREYYTDYFLIAVIVIAALVLLSIIFYIAAASARKKELKRAYAEEVAEDEEAVYDVEDVVAEPVAAETCEKPKKITSFKDLKTAVSEKLSDEKVRKVATVAAACAVTAVVVSQVGRAAKAKRRRQFYRWLG